MGLAYFDFWLSRFQWFRRLRGGLWWKTHWKDIGTGLICWDRSPPWARFSPKIVAIENYAMLRPRIPWDDLKLKAVVRSWRNSPGSVKQVM